MRVPHTFASNKGEISSVRAKFNIQFTARDLAQTEDCYRKSEKAIITILFHVRCIRVSIRPCTDDKEKPRC